MVACFCLGVIDAQPVSSNASRRVTGFMLTSMYLVCRFIIGMILACVYQIALNPLIQSVLFAITGHWRIASYWAGTWFLLTLAAVITGIHRTSRLPGLDEVPIFTARKWLNLLGDEEQGWTPAFLVSQWPRWVPRWVIAWSCCAWRNKLRNIAFWKPLAWLHHPPVKQQEGFGFSIGPIHVSIEWRGWMTEIKWDYEKRHLFGDIGPRFDLSDAYGGVTWAFRVIGKW